MTIEAVELVRREYSAFADRNWAALEAVWHPEIEYEVLMGAGTFKGLEAITEFFDSYAEVYSDFRVEAVEIVEVGDQVVAVERLAGRGLRGSDAWVRESFARLISFKDGRIWRAKEYATREEAIEAAAGEP